MNEVEDDAIKQILQSAGKHPNSRVSKLIHTVQEEETQKNIVLLLIELAENSEYATDFNISLRYYLDLFNNLQTGYDIVLNEAGLLLLNASKIYARRVDYIHELVERQILTISCADNEIKKGKNDGSENVIPSNTTKVKRGRKRLLEEPNDPFEIEMEPKKIRKLTDEKRFSLNKPNVKMRATEQLLPNMDTEQYAHPACWLHSRILDFDNEDNIDSKRNYKLFTYHVEHRYNTLVPDINFRLHFKVKDYLDQEEDERLVDGESTDDHELNIHQTLDSSSEVWPPLSYEYVRKYLRLENDVLDHECSLPKRKRKNSCNEVVSADSALNRINIDLRDHNSTDLNQTALDKVQNSELNHSNTTDDSAVDDSLHNTSTNELEISENIENLDKMDRSNTTIDTSALDNISSESILQPSNDSGFSESMTENNTSTEEEATNNTIVTGNNDDMQNSNENTEKVHDEDQCDKSSSNNNREIRVHMPHLDDEGVFFSELTEQDVRMLSPTVVATDVFPLIPNKENLTIIVDDQIKSFLNLDDDEPEIDKESLKADYYGPIVINIMKIHEKFLRRRVLFRLGSEFENFKQTRLLKRTRNRNVTETRSAKTTKYFSLKDTDMTGVPITPPPSPGRSSDEDFLGFSDEDENDRTDILHNIIVSNKDSRLSRDSGVGTDMHINTIANSDNIDDVILEETVLNHELISTSANESISCDNSNSLDTTQDMEVANKLMVDTPVSEGQFTNILTQDNGVINDFLSEWDINNSKTKIQKWHEHLQPILAKSRERHHFDVFELGTEIIDKFENQLSPLRHTTFQDVMEDKESSYVSRYFLSTLLLANQGNLKINVQNKSTEEPSSWSDVQLELVNTCRHTVAMEDNIGIIGNINSKQTQCASAVPESQMSTSSKFKSDVINRKKLKLNVDTSTPTHGLLTPPATPLSATITPINCNFSSDRILNYKASNNNVLNVNLSTVKPLKQVEKIPQVNDDDDSGIFSREELAL